MLSVNQLESQSVGVWRVDCTTAALLLHDSMQLGERGVI